MNGATDGRFLDDPAFEPILARAEKLDLPIYLHPGIPTEPVRRAYYDNLPGNFSFILALSAWGWHADTAIHTLRLVLSGALDRHPGLKIVIGHMGEALPFMLDRIDETTAATAKTHLRRSVRQTILDQVWITTSGFFTMVPFMSALMSFGVDRIMFSVDYPFASNARARAFLDALPVSPADRAKIAHGNADRLLRLPADTHLCHARRVHRETETMTEAKLAPNLPGWMQDHANRYLSSGGTEGHMYQMTQPGRPEITVPSLLLTTTGRKSGEKYIFPLF